MRIVRSCFYLAISMLLILIMTCFTADSALVDKRTATTATKNGKSPGSGAANQISDCEKKCHVSFSAAQRQQLCAGVSSKSIGPALCGSVAKDSLHLPIDKIIELCKHSQSVHPATCYESLSSKHRSTVGIKLCAGAISDFQSKCFATLITVKGALKNETALVNYCRQNAADDNFAPIECVSKVSNDNLIAFPLSLSACDSAVSSNNTITCINDFHSFTPSTIGLKPIDIVRLCASSPDGNHQSGDGEYRDITTDESIGRLHSSIARCFFASFNYTEQKSGHSSVISSNQLSHSQRYDLCQSAPGNGLGPAVCALFAQIAHRSGPMNLKADDVVSLCSGAQSTGPLNCFIESKGLGNTEQRIDLCRGAINSGIAGCFRKASSVFRNDMTSQQHLCVGAMSEDPAICAKNAPRYLADSERINLCVHTPVSEHSSPIACLESVERTIKLFSDAHKYKMLLGYDYAMIKSESDRRLREGIFSMCSFASSMSPRASAECLKAAPSLQTIATAVHICTNVSSPEVVAFVTHCQRSLSAADWPRDVVANLCKDAKSNLEVQSILNCATSLHDKPLANSFRFAQDEIVSLCRTDIQPQNAVLSCIKAATSSATSIATANKHAYNPATVATVCHNTSSDGPGKCLSFLATNSFGATNYLSNYPMEMVQYICKLADAQYILDASTDSFVPVASTKQILACLDSKKGSVSSRTVEDITACAITKQVPSSVQILRFYSEDDNIHVTAGLRFSTWIQLYDQYNQKITFHQPYQNKHGSSSSNSNNNRGWLFSVSINENNAQGAVLWGTRTNTSHTSTGLVQFNNLVITQPGQVELKIWYYDEDSADSNSNSVSISSRKSVAVFYLNVLENPLQVNSQLCTFIFRQAATSIYTSEELYLSTFPKIIGQFPSIYYSRLFACAVILESWNVSLFTGSQMNEVKVFHIEYRQGIDSVWTGIDFPSLDMSYEERLGFNNENDCIRYQQNQKHLLQQQQLKHRRTRRSLEDTDDADIREDNFNIYSDSNEMNCLTTIKQLKRAYYRKSLLWHPDRWSNMPIYKIPVQGAFELISEAYEYLQEKLKSQQQQTTMPVYE